MAFLVPNLDREQRQLRISSVVLSSQRVRPVEALHRVHRPSATYSADPLARDGLRQSSKPRNR